MTILTSKKVPLRGSVPHMTSPLNADGFLDSAHGEKLKYVVSGELSGLSYAIGSKYNLEL